MLVALMTKRRRLAAVVVRQVLQGRTLEQVLVVGGGDPIGDGVARQQAAEDGAEVDGGGRQRLYRIDDDVQVAGDALAVEGEILPAMAEHARGDRSARHAGDALELLQQPGLVEPDQRAEVEHHGAVATAGQAERNAVLGRAVGMIVGVELR
jgi:hypothetical protein